MQLSKSEIYKAVVDAAEKQRMPGENEHEARARFWWTAEGQRARKRLDEAPGQLFEDREDVSKSDSPITAGNALDEATRKAKALMKEDAAKYPTIEQARAHIWASNADLKKRYDDERKQAH